VTVLTPLLYQALAEREDLPQLQSHLINRLGERLEPYIAGRPVDRYAWVLDEFGLGRFLRPVEFRSAAAQGSLGVPLLAPDDLTALLGTAERRESRPNPVTSWWEFWRTDQDAYAMFPADATPDFHASILLPAVDGNSAQLRVLDLGLTVTEHGEVQPEPPSAVPAAPCIHDARADVPGAPYQGNCRNQRCDHTCSPRVVLNPDDGLYQLTGCNC
jgi:hypothetical protein